MWFGVVYFVIVMDFLECIVWLWEFLVCLIIIEKCFEFLGLKIYFISDIVLYNFFRWNCLIKCFL